jgi:hypothetical protein
VQVDVPELALHEQLGRGGLVSSALSVMRDADPFGAFDVGRHAEYDLHLHLGATPPPNAAKHLTVIGSQGWMAAVRRSSLDFAPGGANPVGAVASAVLGGAQLFRDALGRGELYPADFLYDAYFAMPVDAHADHGPFRHTELGRVLMVGAGSVGSAAAYFMRLFSLRADLTVADADEVKVVNFGRSPLFGRSNWGGPKVKAIGAALHGSGITPRAIPAWWHDTSEKDLGKYDIVLPVANEFEIRYRLQQAYPPLMVHASTGKNWNANFGRHIPGRDDCLQDRFVGFAAPAQTKCAAGEVAASPEGKQVDAALPFLSFWAGFLMAADLVRLGYPGYPHTPNFGNYSFRLNRFTPQLRDEQPRPNCDCRKQGGVFAACRAEGRFSSLSPASW